ncbi:putative beta-lactamase [Pedobacter sp. BAL39]|uniref:serine hydrolase n=1 Tax=Pedobacter sp. BAL39 TaxID=391596 RepID=UPI000155AC48|nr:serine hydrolase [Pedobacter sp. BAL39]EDM34713.1 putative beta-lactamase [Pedobacter sp. BAL39]
MKQSIYNIFKINSGLFICLLICGSSLYGQSTVEERIREVESNLSDRILIKGTTPMNIEERMAHYHVKGLSIAVIRDYKLEWAKAYGFADEAQKVPVTPYTRFQAASISKSLNGVGILKLHQNRKVDLDADINSLLKTWKFPYDSLSKGKKINLKNLLSHTAGLSVHGFGGYEPGTSIPTVIQILDGSPPANSAAVRSEFEPGLKSQYSGGGTTITQLIVSDITDQPYEQFMATQVLKPLGMTNSTFSFPAEHASPADYATGYDTDGKEIKGKYHLYPERAAAALWTTPTDLARYIIETELSYQGKSKKVLDQQSTILRLTPYSNDEAALGVFIEDAQGTKYFGHGGANEGFRSGYYGSFEGGNGLVIMVNSDNGEIIQELMNSISRVYGFKGLNKSKEITLAQVTELDLQPYLGKYELMPGFVLSITNEGNRLFAQATGQTKLEVYPETSSKFFYKVINANMEFVKDASGNVNKMIFTQGKTIEAKKLTN